MSLIKRNLPYLIGFVLLTACGNLRTGQKLILFEDDFAALPRGPLGSEVGAHTEYHFLHQAKPKGAWAISTFRSNIPPSWHVRAEEGQKYICQDAINPNEHFSPMLIAGSPFWNDYTVRTSLKPDDSSKERIGIVFRYQHDRSYYFFGLENDSAKLLKVDQAMAYHQPYEKMLAGESFIPSPGKPVEIMIKVNDSNIDASIDNGLDLSASDASFTMGKIGFLADVPASFYPVRVSCSKDAYNRYAAMEQRSIQVTDSLIDANPKPVVYRKIRTRNFGVGRNLRFGDLDGDGEIDVLVGQVMHHGPKDRNSELSCMTALNLDGEILWQIGSPDPWKNHLTNDVGFQIHDIDNDGINEVIYTMNQELIIAEAATGKTLRSTPTPLTPGGAPTSKGHNIFERILGDCIYFADFSGKGFRGDIVLKDRYTYLWAYNNALKLLWHNQCITGHYPYSYDTDQDGRDELMMGYTLFDDDGTKLWSLDEKIKDHADGVAIVKYTEKDPPVMMCAASDEGIFFADLEGNILKHHYLGHVQNPAVANFRDDLPGLETVSVNFWGNQGIINLYDANGNVLQTFEPNQYGSMCLPLNWNGIGEELFILNPNVDEGGAWDGYGRKAFVFPDDGHPDMCYAVMDITGDCRDEIVVWDPDEIWVYTQDDNPRSGKLYQPVRNPLSNYSNYQATVSLPGWN